MFHSPLPRTLPAALRDIVDPKVAVRVSAARDLVPHGGDHREEVVAALDKALTDSNGLVRAAAAEGLGELCASEALRGLLICVEDEQQLVRQKAIAALGEIGDGRAQKRLERALKDDRPEVRFQAVIAYPRVCSDKRAAMQKILAATRDEDEHVAHIAFRMGEELADEHGVDEALLARARVCLKHTSGRIRAVSAVILGHADDAAADDVLCAIAAGKVDSPEGEDIAAAIELVGKRKLSSAEPALLRRAFSGIMGFRRDTFAWHALIALCLLGNERAKRAIVEDVGSLSRSTRTLAVSAVGRAKLVEARPVLVALEQRPDKVDPGVVRTALDLLDRAEAS